MLWIVSAAYATALLTGHFEGFGNACHGKLTLGANALAWRTTDSNCTAAAPKILAQDGDEHHPSIVVELDKHPQCGFRVIKLEADEAKPHDWTLTGYLNLDDYQNRQLATHERLVCKVRKVGTMD